MFSNSGETQHTPSMQEIVHFILLPFLNIFRIVLEIPSRDIENETQN